MCLILFAYERHPRYRLVFAANRDEFYNRPSEELCFWRENPSVLAGKDLAQGGTWLGMTKEGKFAALTNYRDPSSTREDAPSRGNLVKNYLESREDAGNYLARIAPGSPCYNGFSIIVGDRTRLLYFSNRTASPMEIEPGIHGLSNHLLDTPWPKIERGRRLFGEALLQKDECLQESLFNVLTDRSRPGDADLPETGVTLEWERILSSIFIDHRPVYGTRSSSVVLIGRDGTVTFTERTFAFSGNGSTDRGGSPPASERTFRFTITDFD